MSSIPSNMVTWFQLPADDVERAWAFYGKVFGWHREEVYRDVKRLGAINGDFALRDDAVSAPRLVIRVNDLDRSLRAVESAGGKIVARPMEIPGMGMIFATFEDSEGNQLNIVADAK